VHFRSAFALEKQTDAIISRMPARLYEGRLSERLYVESVLVCNAAVSKVLAVQSLQHNSQTRIS
jgi:hypothetical protein